MTQHVPTPADQCSDIPAEVTTVVMDQLRNEVLLRLQGAVVLPTGSAVALADGEIARVASLRLEAGDKARPQLIIHVVRSQRATRPTR